MYVHDGDPARLSSARYNSVVTYRDELEQAHRRIEQLEEQLEEERRLRVAVDEVPKPPPETKKAMVNAVATPERITLIDWWPLPILVLSMAIYLLVCGFTIPELGSDRGTIAFLLASGFFGSGFMFGELLLRRKNGRRTLAGRLMIVAAVIVGAPAGIAAFMLGGPILGIGMALVAAIGGIVGLVKWIAKGDS